MKKLSILFTGAALCLLLAFPIVIYAQNHNPEFEVSNLSFSGANYIFIGEDDDEVMEPPRTEITLRYRDGGDAPEDGTTTLEWVTDGGADDGSTRVLAFDAEDTVTGGFTDGDGDQSKTGPWYWTGGDAQESYPGNALYLQGVADTLDAEGNVTNSYSGNTVKLKASHSDSSNVPFDKEFDLINKPDLSVTDPAGVEVQEQDEEDPGMVIASADENGNFNTRLIAKAVDAGGNYRMRLSQDIPLYSDSSGSNSVTLTASNGEYVTTEFDASSDTTYYVSPPENVTGVITAELDWWEDGEPVTNQPTIEGADTVTLLKVDVVEVCFEAPDGGTNYHELKSDDLSVTYSAPHWVDANGDGDADDTGDTNYPVAFTRNTKPEIGVSFDLGTGLSGQTIKFKATGPGGIAIPETDVSSSLRYVTIAPVESTGAFVDTIKHYDHKTSGEEFELAWEMQIGSSGWFSVGETKHTLYLTLADPVTTLRQETLFYLSCKNADGDSSEGVARDSMYTEFTNRDVERLDGVQMTYWVDVDGDGQADSTCTDTPDILSNTSGNGNCQAWAGLFRDILRIHGVNADRMRVWPKNPDSSVIVKDWQFNDPPSGPPQHPYIEGLDAFDLHGIAGQGNDNPPGAFNGHWITKSGGSYYDPSYGTPKVNNEKAYEDGSFDGFGASYPTSGGSSVRGIRKNNTGAGNSEVDFHLAN